MEKISCILKIINLIKKFFKKPQNGKKVNNKLKKVSIGGDYIGGDKNSK